MKTEYWLIIIALIIGFGLGFYTHLSCSKPNQIATGGILQNRDSIGYEVVMGDTIIVWYEKIVYKESKPIVTYIQKVDSVFIELMKDYDLITKVIKKRNGDMTLFIYNQNGKELKRLEFESVGNSFEITSQKNNVFVKSNLWNWNGIYFKSLFKNPINSNWKNEGVLDNSINTGINFNNLIDLNIGLGYNKINQFNINLETNIKLK